MRVHCAPQVEQHPLGGGRDPHLLAVVGNEIDRHHGEEATHREAEQAFRLAAAHCSPGRERGVDDVTDHQRHRDLGERERQHRGDGRDDYPAVGHEKPDKAPQHARIDHGAEDFLAAVAER